MLKRLSAAFLVALAAFALDALAEVPVPALKARVTDLTGTLSAEQKSALEQRIAAFEAKKGSQLAVLMLPTTKPEEIEQYSIRVAEAWKIGRKGTDDGLILIVAKDDRRLRVEVGYGLEGAIPDGVANRVISETITPRFKAGDFYGGISAGVDQLIRLVEGEKLPPPSSQQSRQSSAQGMDFMQWIVPAIFFVLIVGGILKAVLGRVMGSAAAGLAAGVIAWLVLGLGIAAIAAIVAFILTFVNAGRGFSAGGLGAGGGGFSSGGSSSWGGGGGSFGGGGASGRW